MARLYRDCGGWRLGFCEGADEVRALVAEMDALEGER